MNSKAVVMIFVVVITLNVALQLPERTWAARIVGGGAGAGIGLLAVHLLYKMITPKD